MTQDLSALRRSIDLVATPMAVLDLEGRIEHVNRANEILLGRTAADLHGRSFDEILPPGPADQGATLLASARNRGHAGGILQHVREDGSRVLVEVLADVVPAAGGSPRWITTSTRDLGPQVRQIEQLSASTLELAAAPDDEFLDTLLRVSRDLLGARYAALAVVEDGRLARFLADGMTADQVAAIGDPPAGHGLLGAMLAERRTIRLGELAADPRSSGFPSGHPPMRSFLGTPIRVGDVVYGHLYLTDKLDAPEFSLLDERLVELLAAHAAIAIRDRARRETLEATSKALERAERDLRDSVVLGQVQDCVIVTDLAGRITFWNRGAETIFGYRADEMVGRTPYDLFAEPGPHDVEAGLAALKRGEEQVGERRARRKDGEIVWVDVRTTLLRDGAGEPSGLIAVGHDVTARRMAELERAAAEASLSVSERTLARVRQVAQVGSWDWDLVTDVITLSDEHARILGLDAGLLATTNEDLLARTHPDDLAAEIEADRRSREDGAPYDLMHRIIRPDGSVRIVHESGDVIRDDAGAPVRLIGTIEDVTDRMQGLARESRLARLLDDVSSEIYLFDADSLRFVEANAAALRNLGYTLEELQQLTPLDLKTRETPASFSARLAPLRTGEASQVHFLASHRRRDGSSYPVEVRVNYPDGESPPLFVAIVSDISERLVAEAERSRLASAVEQAADSIIISDPDHTVTYVNKSFGRLYGYAPDEIVGRHLSALDSGQQTAAFWEERWATVTTGSTWTGTIINRRKDGSEIVLESVTSPILDAEGRVVSIVQTDRDVTRERDLEAALEREAAERRTIESALERIDPAGSPEQIAEAACLSVVRMHQVESVWVVELWPGGGRILAAAGGVAGSLVPGQVIPARRARYLLEHAASGPWTESWTTRAPVDAYDEKLLATGLQTSVIAPLHGPHGPVGVIAFGSHDADGTDRIIERLPAVATFGSIIGALVGAALENRRRHDGDRADIQAILDDRSYRPFFQPVVDLHERMVVGYEALSRFSGGARPDVVFALAAQVGLGLELEVATARAAIEASSILPPGSYLSLNVSPDLIGSGELPALLADFARPVVLEVTEHVAIQDYATLRRQLRSLGRDVRLAIDDAGAGYASLRHILELDPALVKLDIGLIRGIDGDPARQALLAGIGYFATKRRIRLVAEGIETVAELDKLLDLAISYGQGYLLGRPQDAAGPDPWPTTIAMPD